MIQKKGPDMFAKLTRTLSEMLSFIDARMQDRYRRLFAGEIKVVHDGHKSIKDFLASLEAEAVKVVAAKTAKTASTVKSHWQVMCMPFPIYCALEENRISFSKAKIACGTNLHPEDDVSIAIAQKFVDMVEAKADEASVKAMLASESKGVWYPSTVVMEYFLGQNMETVQREAKRVAPVSQGVPAAIKDLASIPAEAVR